MKNLSTLGLIFGLTACASVANHDEPTIATTATGTVTMVNTSTSVVTNKAPEISLRPSNNESTATGISIATSAAEAAKPARDVIAGQVVGEEPMMEVSKHANVRLLHAGDELANITADSQGNFRFEGIFPQGRYEISVRDGKLHGAREISFSGGEATGMNVLVTDGKGDHHHRRRRKHH